ATDVGLEYLLGVVEEVDGAPRYDAIWARDQDEERLAFQRFLDLVTDRLDAHPDMHVYHYGGYEAGAIKRLMSRHGVGQDQVDRLLRGGVLIDLLNVVRQGIRGSVESYSLKQVEKSYMPVREGPVTEAGFSVVAFETWLKERDQTILDGIADYNRDDCVSTYRLRSWLEGWRAKAVQRWPDLDWTRPVPADGAPSEGVSDWLRDVAARESALIDLASDEPDIEVAAAERLLADLLDWHRREEKSQWWRWYELREKLTIEQLVVERDALAGLSFVDEMPLARNMLQRRYRFEPQDHGFDPGDVATDRDTGKGAGTIVDIDDAEGVITLRRSANAAWPHPNALIGSPPLDSVVLKRAMLRVADAVLEHGIDGDGPFRAIRDLVLRRGPRGTDGPAGQPLQQPHEDVTSAALRVGHELESGILPIQGPPGTGKTYTAARMILDLVADHRTVGVTAQSHKTISNLLEAIAEALASDRRWSSPRVLQRAGVDNDHAGHLPFVTLAENADVEAAIAAGTVDIVAGTPWLFARPPLEGMLDVLFVDEAGQMSTANVVAMGTAARSIVLVGDPNQLPMVSQGVHPEGAGASALEHLVGGSATVAPDRGLFLATTRRLHPNVNRYISRTFYDGLLESHPATVRQMIDGDDDLAGAGLRWVPVEHTANGPRSREEAEVVADLTTRLIGRRWTDSDGSQRRIGLEDIIVVAPYNAQVAAIQAALVRRLNKRANVGTVDKFQGREGVVAIFSMASSSREDAPRDMGFLYSRNRLNVAVSRARSLAIIVASPRLLEAGARSPEQMHALSALCGFVEMATGRDPD
ncbi:MAG: TM0106 family RecB-like putative nuclease, partial [Candidatus Limnocylindrales bacterium]